MAEDRVERGGILKLRKGARRGNWEVDSTSQKICNKLI